MLQAYRDHTAERELEGIPPKPLDSQQVADDVYRYLNFNEMEYYQSAADAAFPVKVA